MPWFIGKPRLVEARHIPTREGDVMLAAPGDWIVRVMHNEFELVKAAIFEQDYEPAEPGPID